MTKHLFLSCACAAALLPLGAGTYHWSGAVDGCWTNAANWVENAVPGQYYDAQGSKAGAAGDTATFDSATLTGAKATTICFDGVYSISNLLTTGTAQFTYGTAAEQYMSFEPGGTFTVAETAATPTAVVACRLRLGIDCKAGGYGVDRNTVIHNGAAEFVLNDWGYSTFAPDHNYGGEPLVTFQGSGPVRVAKTNANDKAGERRITLKLTGVFTVGAPLYLRFLSIPYVSGITTPLRIEITENGALGPSGLYGFFSMDRDLIIFGAGTFYYAYGKRNSQDVVNDDTVYRHLTLQCPVASVMRYDAPADDFKVRACFVGADTSVSRVTFAGGSSFAGTIQLRSNGGSGVLIETESFGKAGTVGGVGDVDFEVRRGGLRHTGAAPDETDRTIAVTNHSASAAGVVSLSQGGTGAWRVTSPVTLLGNSTTAELRLIGDGTGTATFAGTLANGISVTKDGTGAWTFTPQGGYTGAIALNNSGRLTLDADVTVTSLTVGTGTGRLLVGAGRAVTVNALTLDATRTLDIALADDTATVTFPNLTSVPENLTVNGVPATLDENHVLKVDSTAGTAWKTATSGAWTDGANWVGGTTPDPEKPVAITAQGADYTVTLDGDALKAATGAASLTLTNLVVNNVGAGTATLLITNGANVTAKRCSAKVVNDTYVNTPALAVGEGGVVNVADSTLRLYDLGRSSNLSDTSQSSILFDRGELNLSGTSSLVLHGIDNSTRRDNGTWNLNTPFNFGTGRITFSDDATWKTEYESGTTVFYHNLIPTRSGETVEMTFTDRARLAFAGNPWVLRLQPHSGRSTLMIDTAYEGTMPGWNNMYVGCGASGVGEFRLLNGKFKTGGWDVMYVGGLEADETSTMTGLFVTGRVEVAEGGSFYAQAVQPIGKNFGGVQFGHATALTKDRGSNFCHGELILNGGIYEQRRASLFFGIGADGDADVFHNGGTMKVVMNPASEILSVNSGGPMKYAMALGAFGGRGRYTMTDGTFNSGIPVYVGGILTNDLNRSHVNGATFAKYHDAQGALTISGGTFATTNNVILGRDGTGTLTLSGTGTLKANAVIVSNTVGAAASALRFVADAQAKCGTINAATKLAFHPGARVVVDVSALAARPRRLVVWTLDNAPEGLDNATFEVEGDETIRAPSGLVFAADGRSLTWNASVGTVLILR